MRGDEIPREAIRNTLRTYAELHKKFDLFLTGQMESSLLIIARSGIGKSFYVKEHANHDITHIMEGNLRPLKTYMELYEHRHKLLVIDDGETLWAEKPGRHIMRQLTETRFPKTMSWTSTVKPLEENGIPITFETNSRACIICNTFRFGRTDETAAILDRCQCYYFDPTNEEVARYVAEWFWDQTVFDCAVANLHAIDRLTARMYVKASERRLNSDPNWKNEFPLLHGPELIVQQVCTSDKFPSAEARIAEFGRLTALLPEREGKAMSRATFMRYQADLKARHQLTTRPPRLRLKVKGQRRDIPVGVEAILADVEQAREERQAWLETTKVKKEDDAHDEDRAVSVRFETAVASGTVCPSGRNRHGSCDEVSQPTATSSPIHIDWSTEEYQEHECY